MDVKSIHMHHVYEHMHEMNHTHEIVVDVKNILLKIPLALIINEYSACPRQ